MWTPILWLLAMGLTVSTIVLVLMAITLHKNTET